MPPMLCPRPHLDGGAILLSSTLDDARAGASLAARRTRILQFFGEQESYKAEMSGMYLNSRLVGQGQVAKFDNQAVTTVAAVEPTQEESDVDLRVPLATTVRRKELRVESIQGHRKDKTYSTTISQMGRQQ